MDLLRAIQWWALAAVLLALSAVVISVVWMDKWSLVIALSLAAITFAVLSLQDDSSESR